MTAEKGLPKLVEPNGVIAEAPAPSESESIMYATMGTGETPVTATLYGAWFCPHTNNFVTDFMDEIIRQYVKPGKVTLRFRAVAYENGEGFHGSNEPKVARAALAVWNEAPEKYWSFFHYLFKNISATETWSVNNVVKLAKAAGVEVTEPVRKAYNGNSTYQDEIAATMDQVQKVPISAVPRIVVGETVSKPSVSHQETIDQLEKALPGST